MPRPPLARHCGALCLWLLGACSSGPRPEAGPWAGSYEWFSTFGGGRLDLLVDGTYHLSLTARKEDGARWELRGSWRVDDTIATLDLSQPDRRGFADHQSDLPPFLASCSSLLAILHQGSAQFLGTDGVIDLNQGF